MHLEVNQLYKYFTTRHGKITALKNVNLHVEDGEFTCVVGASGSGKSTLLRIVAGLESASEGEVTVDGQKIIGPGADRGMVFQRYTLYPWLSVLDNVAFGLKLQGISKRERHEKALYYLNVVGLNLFKDALPKQLSGGMKQRVAIARALASEPKILLMDEPFGALDILTKENMQQFMLELWEKTKTTVLLITHDVEEAVFLGQRVYVMTAHPGQVREEVIVNLPTDSGYKIKRSSEFLDYKYHLMELMRGDSSDKVATP
ncbi:Taurine-transporting ATPase [[Leptolyngbya] sp. PCC 7376]|uniref:ABC transporter ATP-binding protein n=1 Tax=[Leptolyngbya] sp. PCC 7376 TaxID=111781 RepID=UPI00029F3418|nr:ABC transporter ATP-binding protein [[Leptolyngbya] sp. PCC 7376]AFY40248.1 Taurine-transporting ATPase [[Leptolyngbya] sp. PCC 7376]